MITKNNKKMRVAVLTGGPSLERGISLNSARSLLDHLADEYIEIIPIYFDYKKNPYLVSTSQLYSNTPSDFDFKLKKTAKKLDKKDFKKVLKSVDIVFPAMHGAFGEDGHIQKILEDWDIPYVGLDSTSAKKCFDKELTFKELNKMGFFTIEPLVIKENDKNILKKIENYFKKENIKRAVVKPATGGSSIGVFSVKNVNDALEKTEYLFSEKIDNKIIIEPFAKGVEFTVILLENGSRGPVALIPTEIETSYKDAGIFDFRKKYLPTNQVTYHCPPRFTKKTIEKIQDQAEQIFKYFGMKDFARFDGWVLDNGNIYFSDLNPISGMEQNSFLFQQGARIGFSHRELLRYIVKNSAAKNKVYFPENKLFKKENKKQVSVLFGGNTSERQVSLMSGTNVWLKLRNSNTYNPKPFLLDLNGYVWELPYVYALNHTVEEILHNCENAEKNKKNILVLREEVLNKLSVKQSDLEEYFFLPKKTSLNTFIKNSPFVFIGLHGGDGENGVIPGKLDKMGVLHNGSGQEACALAMDKYKTGEKLKNLESFGIYTIPKKMFKISDIKDFRKEWDNLVQDLNSKTFIVKPVDDGCSSGIVHLYNSEDFKKYITLAKKNILSISVNTFTNQKNIIEMPTVLMENILLEPFIETDDIKVENTKLIYKKKTGWVEVTVGVLEENNKMHAMNPSITIAETSVLSVEEKFQGGTGVNITPPPEKIISKNALDKAKKSIEKVAEVLGISGYARIDAFMNLKSGDIKVIESNNLPGLTPSTVIYHQALAEKKSMNPTEFLEQLIKNKGY